MRPPAREGHARNVQRRWCDCCFVEFAWNSVERLWNENSYRHTELKWHILGSSPPRDIHTVASMVTKIRMKVLLRAVVAAAVVAGAGAWFATRPGHQGAAPPVSASGANVANVTTEKAPTTRGKGQPQPAPSPTAGTRRHTNVEP